MENIEGKIVGALESRLVREGRLVKELRTPPRRQGPEGAWKEQALEGQSRVVNVDRYTRS